MVRFFIDNLGGGSGEVGSVGCGFFVGFEQGVVEYGVDSPRLWEGEFAVDWIGLEYFEWAVSFRCQFNFGMCRLDIGSFQPY